MTRVVILCACALFIGAVAKPAPPKRTIDKVAESNLLHERNEAFVSVRRVPNKYYFPISLWPVPKYANRDENDEFISYYTYSVVKDMMKAGRR